LVVSLDQQRKGMWAALSLDGGCCGCHIIKKTNNKEDTEMGFGPKFYNLTEKNIPEAVIETTPPFPEQNNPSLPTLAKTHPTNAVPRTLNETT